MMKYFLIIIVPIISYAISEKVQPVQNELETIPSYILDHVFEGCPTNSECTKNSGAKFQSYNNVVESIDSGAKKIENYNKLIKQIGYPYPVWVIDEHKNVDDLVYWDSPCESHRKSKPKIFIGQVFKKNVVYSNESQTFKFQPLIIFNRASTPKLISAPRNLDPVGIDSKGRIAFNTFYNGSYFSILQSENGDIEIGENFESSNNVKSISCPKEVSPTIKGFSLSENLFKNFSCLQIYDPSLKKWVIFVKFWNC